MVDSNSNLLLLPELVLIWAKAKTSMSLLNKSTLSFLTGNLISTSEEQNENKFSFCPSGVETKGLMPCSSVARQESRALLWGIVPFILGFALFSLSQIFVYEENPFLVKKAYALTEDQSSNAKQEDSGFHRSEFHRSSDIRQEDRQADRQQDRQADRREDRQFHRSEFHRSEFHRSGFSRQEFHRGEGFHRSGFDSSQNRRRNRNRGSDNSREDRQLGKQEDSGFHRSEFHRSGFSRQEFHRGEGFHRQ